MEVFDEEFNLNKCDKKFGLKKEPIISGARHTYVEYLRGLGHNIKLLKHFVDHAKSIKVQQLAKASSAFQLVWLFHDLNRWGFALVTKSCLGCSTFT